jgi:hypothetical protein
LNSRPTKPRGSSRTIITPLLPLLGVNHHAALVPDLLHQGHTVAAQLPLDAALQGLTQLQETLDLLDARARLAHEVRAKDAVLLPFANKLCEAHHVLDRLVDDYAHYRRDPKRPHDASTSDDPEVSSVDFGASVHSWLKLNDILTYAHRISYTTFIPSEHGAGLPLRGRCLLHPRRMTMTACPDDRRMTMTACPDDRKCLLDSFHPTERVYSALSTPKILL